MFSTPLAARFTNSTRSSQKTYLRELRSRHANLPMTCRRFSSIDAIMVADDTYLILLCVLLLHPSISNWLCSGSGYKALCTQSRTWEVTVKCTGNCASLPSPDPPGSYSDRWAPTCIGLAENQTCTAECSCSGAKFVAECDTNGSYVVKPGACNACPGPIINGEQF